MWTIVRKIALVLGGLSLLGMLPLYVVLLNPNSQLAKTRPTVFSAILAGIAVALAAYALVEGIKALGNRLRRKTGQS